MWPEVQHISSDLVHGFNGAKGLTIHVLDGVQTMLRAVRSGKHAKSSGIFVADLGGRAITPPRRLFEAFDWVVCSLIHDEHVDADGAVRPEKHLRLAIRTPKRSSFTFFAGFERNGVWGGNKPRTYFRPSTPHPSVGIMSPTIVRIRANVVRPTTPPPLPIPGMATTPSPLRPIDRSRSYRSMSLSPMSSESVQNSLSPLEHLVVQNDALSAEICRMLDDAFEESDPAVPKVATMSSSPNPSWSPPSEPKPPPGSPSPDPPPACFDTRTSCNRMLDVLDRHILEPFGSSSSSSSTSSLPPLVNDRDEVFGASTSTSLLPPIVDNHDEPCVSSGSSSTSSLPPLLDEREVDVVMAYTSTDYVTAITALSENDGNISNAINAIRTRQTGRFFVQ